MASLTKSEVLHVAKLAKLNITNKEAEKYLRQLSKVVEFVGELSEIDTDETLPTSQTTGLEDVLRADEIKSENCLTQDQALSGSDKTYNGYFKVPAILSERSDK